MSLLRERKYSAKEIAEIVGVSEQVVMGFKSHLTRGKYGDGVRIRREKKAPKAGSASWTYLLLSCKGEVYLGATTDLKQRLRSHNAKGNDGFTKGRRWHLLAAKRFQTRKEAFAYETFLKVSGSSKREWKIASISRAIKIVEKFSYPFDPKEWLVRKDATANPAVQGALRDKAAQRP